MVVSAYEIFMVYGKNLLLNDMFLGVVSTCFLKSGSMGLYFLGLSIIKIFSNIPCSSRGMSSWDQALKKPNIVHLHV